MQKRTDGGVCPYFIPLSFITNLITNHLMTLPQRKSLRLKDFDYSTSGYYFLTLVTKNRMELFGEIIDDKMHHNNAGQMIMDSYLTIPNQFPTIKCMDAVVMPNHFHCILEVCDNNTTTISAVMRWWKSLTTHKYIEGAKQNQWEMYDKKLWQNRYFDHIIRNQHDFDMIRNYIFQNPSRWKKDCFYQ